MQKKSLEAFMEIEISMSKMVTTSVNTFFKTFHLLSAEAAVDTSVHVVRSIAQNERIIIRMRNIPCPHHPTVRAKAIFYLFPLWLLLLTIYAI